MMFTPIKGNQDKTKFTEGLETIVEDEWINKDKGRPSMVLEDWDDWIQVGPEGGALFSLEVASS
jgi:hypothetical protein